jgi:hypothetical protein
MPNIPEKLQAKSAAAPTELFILTLPRCRGIGACWFRMFEMPFLSANRQKEAKK